MRGFRGTSIADLADACAMSKSLFYHYYPSKEDVLFAVMASHVDELVAEVAAVETLSAAPLPRLQMLLRAFLARYVGAADRQKVLLNELANLPPERRRRIVAQQRAIVDAVQRLLVAIDPELAPAPARARAMLLLGAVNWTHTWYDPAGPVDPDTLADMALALASGDQAS